MTIGTRDEPVAKANEHGHDLYRWETDQPILGVQQWACCAYDHGPLCRRCRPIHDPIANVLDLVEDGIVSVYDEDRGGWTFGPRDPEPLPLVGDVISRLTNIAAEIDGRATGPDMCNHAAVAMRDAARIIEDLAAKADTRDGVTG